jgi:hypothetical protein
VPPAEPSPPTFAEVQEHLYGVDLDEFVRERTAAAKELRGQGERGEAAAVARLAKPSVAAWIVNRVARDEPGPVGALLDAGATLREVQMGAGSAADLRAAAEQQEAALRAVMRAAEKVASGRGSATAATLDKVRETLHAAALDAELADQMRRGVLVREQRAVGFPVGLEIPADRRRPPPAPKTARAPRRAVARAAPPDEVGAKRRERAAGAAQDAQEALGQAEADVAAARDEDEAARHQVDRARKALAGAEQRTKAARRELDRAEKAHTKAARQAERALQRLNEIEDSG